MARAVRRRAVRLGDEPLSTRRMCRHWRRVPPGSTKPESRTLGLPCRQLLRRCRWAALGPVLLRQGENEKVITRARAELRRQAGKVRRRSPGASAYRHVLPTIEGVTDRKAADR